jgi:hypothetical protein
VRETDTLLILKETDPLLIFKKNVYAAHCLLPQHSMFGWLFQEIGGQTCIVEREHHNPNGMILSDSMKKTVVAQVLHRMMPVSRIGS